jgi:hypothetical protein
MNFPDPSTAPVVSGLLLLAALFVIREFASGALKKTGQDL